jgi:hypothetical protein
MKTENTFIATINVGLKEGYDGKIHGINEVKSLCQQYCDEVGAVTVSPLTFVHTKGNEELKEYIKALESNISKSVLRRLDLQLDRDKYEKE